MHGRDGAADSGPSDDQRLSEAPFAGSGRAVHAGTPLCQNAGLLSLGHVALDGTKIRANDSKHTAMRDSRMKTAEPALATEAAQWLAKAAASAA